MRNKTQSSRIVDAISSNVFQALLTAHLPANCLARSHSSINKRHYEPFLLQLGEVIVYTLG